MKGSNMSAHVTLRDEGRKEGGQATSDALEASSDF